MTLFQNIWLGICESNKNEKKKQQQEGEKANTKANHDTYDVKDAEEHQVKVWFIFLLTI